MATSPSAYLEDSYATKVEHYYNSARLDYLAELPADPAAAILELGCGNGATGALALQQGKCGTYVGIEMFEPVAREAEQVLSAVHIGDVATLPLPYGRNHFDVLICSEVLEHLVDPAAVLGRLAELVKPGGLVLASSPNIAHWSIVAELIRGRFRYADFGAMDRTHLRWFTPESFAELFEGAGFEVTALNRLGTLPGWKRRLYALLGRRFGHLTWYQIDVRGRKKG
ncbi:MAG TPA: class I SAM-dependent methyltransferase [Allosphingosinicella sp.]|nr:class I SAM-dependent methyltransferase [Allosphingosinicella sp.]